MKDTPRFTLTFPEVFIGLMKSYNNIEDNVVKQELNKALKIHGDEEYFFFEVEDARLTYGPVQVAHNPIYKNEPFMQDLLSVTVEVMEQAFEVADYNIVDILRIINTHQTDITFRVY